MAKLTCIDAHIVGDYTNREQVYFQIEYLPVGQSEWQIGFGSCYLDLVQKWFNEEIEVIEPSNWIPVDMFFPDEMDNVLVCTKNGGRTIAHLSFDRKTWEDAVLYYPVPDVVAWMYLPPSWEGCKYDKE